jgi:hypothetical protein
MPQHVQQGGMISERSLSLNAPCHPLPIAELNGFV